ncbi:MAG TPA: hypothetical protein VHA33_20250 [Candidatus Angelobacter sp.]|nr:hypothetical protein [Candidatus Angelobacter sp.]
MNSRQNANAQPLSECLKSIDTPEGRQRVTTYLDGQPFPHYRPDPDKPGLLERIEEDGTRTIGRFVNRRFKTSSSF